MISSKEYIILLKKGLPKLVNLDTLGSAKNLVSALNNKAVLLITACFKRVSPVRFQIFKIFCEHVMTMKRNHGNEHVVKYLKACHLAIQRYIAGKPVNSLKEIAGPGVYPSLRSGLPKFILKGDRALIRNQHTAVIRFYLTLFSVYRILYSPWTMKLSTITDPFKGKEGFIEEFNILSEITIDLHFKKINSFIKPLENFSFLETSSAPRLERVSWLQMRSKALDLSKSHLYDSFNKLRLKFLSPTLNTFFNSLLLVPLQETNEVKGYLKKKHEPAGKVRVFAMVDIWTQNVLKPIHDAMFTFLKTLPNDGTFDQWASVQRCVEKAKRYKVSYGYDLSAATDRLPILIQSNLLNIIFGDQIGNSWAKLLVGRRYELDTAKEGPKNFYYSVGQPMGALSSWASLAITHHLIMQVSSRLVYHNVDWFDKYELLGDDIIIFDELVAIQYLSLMRDLGVEINESKSVISPDGRVIEFAKKTYLNGINVSSLPWKAILVSKTSLDLASLIYSLHDKLDVSQSYKWLRNWAHNKDLYNKRWYYLKWNLLRILTSKNVNLWHIITDRIITTFGNISKSNAVKIGAYLDTIIPLLYQKKEIPFVNNFRFSNIRTSMFIMKLSAPMHMLKSRDLSKDAEELSRNIFFKLYPEFDNKYHRENLYLWNITSNYEVPFIIYGSLYHIIDGKLRGLLNDFRNPILRNDNLEAVKTAAELADRYFEFLELLTRSENKLANTPKRVSVSNIAKTIKKINLTNFKFY